MQGNHAPNDQDQDRDERQCLLPETHADPLPRDRAGEVAGELEPAEQGVLDNEPDGLAHSASFQIL